MQKIKQKEKFYNIAVCVLSISSVAFSIIDFTNGLNQIQILMDRIIYIIFIVDYITRLFMAKDKKYFFKSNILDILAILPFNSAFRFFRILKLTKVLKFTRLLKLTKLIKIGAVFSRSASKFKRFFKTNGFKYVLYLTMTAIVISSLSMMYFENMSLKDALWWSFVTATTVGYGDLSPSTTAGRIIASILMLTGIGLLGSLTSTITTFFLTPNSIEKIDDSKIEMCLLLYNNLSDTEKELFKNKIE